MNLANQSGDELDPLLQRRSVVVQHGRGRIEVRGLMALIVSYLVSAPGLAVDLERMVNGQLHITWGPGGPFKAKVEKYYPEAKSSSLMDESS